MNRDELVEHLHNEIASRDERIGELENVASYYASRNEELREEVAAIKAQGVGCQQARLNLGFDEYTSREVALMTMAFNAALDSIIIELPELKNSSSYYDGGQ